MIETITQTAVDFQVIQRQARRFGTPLYVYDGQLFETRSRALQDCLPPGFDLYYAVKANPLLGVLQLFCQTGTGAEVSSEGELCLALKAGFPPQRIIYTCPGKTVEGLRLAIRNNIYWISLESIYEAEYVNKLAEEMGRDAVRVSIRINPDVIAPGAWLAMSGRSTQFGIDETVMEDILEGWEIRYPRLILTGIQVYAGTQILDAEKIAQNADKTIQLALSLSARYHLRLRCIDLGGGFGIPYQDDEAPELDLPVLKNGYQRLAERYKDVLPDTRIIVESGRYLTASGGEFITRVLGTKTSKGKRFVICDGGYSHHPAAHYIQCHGRNRYPIRLLPSGVNEKEKDQVTVTGPTGTPIDILGRDIELPRAMPGDLLAVGLSGAYGYTNSCQLFFSGRQPAEIMLFRGQWHVLRNPGTIERLINDMGNIH